MVCASQKVTELVRIKVRARARTRERDLGVVRWCASNVSQKSSGASFFTRRSAKSVSTSLSAAFDASALRLAARLSNLSLWMRTASRHVS
eukprot:907024-Pleurochrysis_carterae.AAC.1